MKSLFRSAISTPFPFLLVGVGGIAGAISRYLIDIVVPGVLVPTLTVNAVGSFALGLLLYGDIYAEVLTNRTRLLLGTGFVSSFTTFSTFVIDIVAVEPLLAVVYIGASYCLGFLGIFLGHTIAKRMVV